MRVQFVPKKIADFLSKFLRTDINYIIRNGFWVSLGHAASIIASLALSILLANFLSKDEYGIYKYALSLIGIFTVTTLPGIGSTITHVIAEGKDGTFLPALFLRIKYGVIGSIITIAVACYYLFIDKDPSIAYPLFIGAFFLPFMDPFGMYGIYLNAKKEFKLVTNLFLIGQLFVFLIMAVTIILTKNAFAVTAAYFATWTVVRLAALKFSLKKHPPTSSSLSSTAIQYGKHASITGLIGQIAASLDSLILFNTLGPSLVAINSMAASPSEQIRNAFKNLPTIAIPKLSHRSAKEINQNLLQRLLILFLIGLGISALLIIAIPYLFEIFLSQYSDAVKYAQWYAPTLALRLPMSFLSSASQSKISYQKKRWIYFSSIPNIFLIISLSILTPLFGIPGIIASRYINIVLTLVTDALRWRTFSKE